MQLGSDNREKSQSFVFVSAATTELGLGGNAVPPKGKGTLAFLPQIPKPQHLVVLHLQSVGCAVHVPSKVVPSKIPHEQQVTSLIN